MPITQAMCTSFKVEVMTATHNFTNGSGNTFNAALFAAVASVPSTFDASTTNFSEMGAEEASGTGYTSGGAALTNVTPTSTGTTAFTDFADLTFSSVTLVSSGCMIYNDTAGGNSVGVYNFGQDISATNGDFTLQFPTADAASAVIRFA